LLIYCVTTHLMVSTSCIPHRSLVVSMYLFARCSNCRPDETQDNFVLTHLSRIVVTAVTCCVADPWRGARHSEDTNTWPDRNHVPCGRVYITQQSVSRYRHSVASLGGSLSKEIILSFIYRPFFGQFISFPVKGNSEVVRVLN
jgi:hypothetical protein